MIDFEKVKRELMSESTDWVDEAPSRPYEAKLRCLYDVHEGGDSFQIGLFGSNNCKIGPIFSTKNALQRYLQKQIRGLISQVDEISNVWHKNHTQESVTDYGFIVLPERDGRFRILLRVQTDTTTNVDLYLQAKLENI